MEEYPRKYGYKERITIPYTRDFDTVKMLISYLSEELTKKAKEIGFNVFAVDRKVSTSRVGVTSNTVTYEVRRG